MQTLMLQELQYNIYLADTSKKKPILSANIFKETPFLFFPPPSLLH